MCPCLFTEMQALPSADKIDTRGNIDISGNIDNLVVADTSDSADLSDIVLANVSTDVYQQTAPDMSRAELNADVKISAEENAQMSKQSLPQDLNVSAAELNAKSETSTVLKTGSIDRKEDVKGVCSPVLPQSPPTPSSTGSSKLAKLDPVARIDWLLESLSSNRLSPVSPSLLASDDVFASLKQQSERYAEFPKVPISPTSRLERLADASVTDRAAEISAIRDESRIVEFKVEDESGAERSYRVDESFVSMRDKRKCQISEKESLSDVSFSATESAADTSITCRNADESSSSGTQEIATCPAALMAATDDSLSLDRLASFSFDDILSADSVLDGDDSQEVTDVEAKDQLISEKPVCNGTLHDETDSVFKPEVSMYQLSNVM